jgi:hypothetical protein
MKNHHVLWLLLCAALIAFGCEGPEGPTGPAGPPGSANVIYSDWYSPEAWILESTFGVSERTYTIETSALTQEIIDHGIIIVYMKFIGLDPAINPLPVIITEVGNNYHFLFRAEADSLKVLYYLTDDPATDPGSIPSYNQVRYVLIPGGVLDEAAADARIPNSKLIGSLDSMPYEEVCRLLDIPE